MEIKNLSDKAAIAFSNRTFKCQDFSNSCDKVLTQSLPDMSRCFDQILEAVGASIYCEGHEWIEDGLECEVLQPGSTDWEKGKIKMTISFSFEFIPAPPLSNESSSDSEASTNSPLDEIHQMVNEV